jgi:hypothetical protein
MDIDGAGRAELTDYHRDCHEDAMTSGMAEAAAAAEGSEHRREAPAQTRRAPRGDDVTRWSYEETFDYARDTVQQALADHTGAPWTASLAAAAAEAAAEVIAENVEPPRPIQTVDTGGRL